MRQQGTLTCPESYNRQKGAQTTEITVKIPSLGMASTVEEDITKERTVIWKVTAIMKYRDETLHTEQLCPSPGTHERRQTLIT